MIDMIEWMIVIREDILTRCAKLDPNPYIGVMAVCDLSRKRWEGRVCKYMHERSIHGVLPQNPTAQKGGSNHPSPSPRQITPWVMALGSPNSYSIQDKHPANWTPGDPTDVMCSTVLDSFHQFQENYMGLAFGEHLVKLPVGWLPLWLENVALVSIDFDLVWEQTKQPVYW